jgi:nucleotide-binding universal stress UspA family protein
MIPKIEKILYATDLSDNARHAFGYAASMANLYSAKITIVHALEGLSGTGAWHMATYLGEERWNDMIKERESEVVEQLRGRLDSFCTEMRTEMQSCPFLVDTIKVKSGKAEEEILKLAKSGEFDLVIMGTHGRGGFVDAMLGSTARRVVRRSPIPVLTVRLPR